VIINLDTGTFVRNDHQDRYLLPPEMRQALETALAEGRPPTGAPLPAQKRLNRTGPVTDGERRGACPAFVGPPPLAASGKLTTPPSNSTVVDAFLCIMVELLARYRDCFLTDDTGNVHFSVAKFVATRPRPLRRVHHRARGAAAFLARSLTLAAGARLQPCARRSPQLADALTQSLLFQMFVQERESAMRGTAESTLARPRGCASGMASANGGRRCLYAPVDSVNGATAAAGGDL